MNNSNYRKESSSANKEEYRIKNYPTLIEVIGLDLFIKESKKHITNLQVETESTKKKDWYIRKWEIKREISKLDVYTVHRI